MGPFLLDTVIGSLVWNLALVSAGAALGASWQQICIWMEMYSGAVRMVLTGLTTLLIFWGAFRRMRKKVS